MVRISNRTCAECGKTTGRNGTYKFGHFLCGSCKRKSSFPKIYEKLGLDKIKWKSKSKYKRLRVRLKWDERKYLWVKHVKETGDEKKATAIMKDVLAAVQSAHIQSQEQKIEEDKKQKKKGIVMPYEVNR